MTLTGAQLEAIVAALLAACAWPVEKVFEALPAMQNAGLLSPDLAADADTRPLAVDVASSAYVRGLLTEMLALPHQILACAARGGSLDGVASAC